MSAYAYPSLQERVHKHAEETIYRRCQVLAGEA